MKWAKVIEGNTVWEWRMHYVSYKALKKIIKKLKQIYDSDSDSTDDPGFKQLTNQFDTLLHKVMLSTLLSLSLYHIQTQYDVYTGFG